MINFFWQFILNNYRNSNYLYLKKYHYKVAVIMETNQYSNYSMPFDWHWEKVGGNFEEWIIQKIVDYLISIIILIFLWNYLFIFVCNRIKIFQFQFFFCNNFLLYSLYICIFLSFRIIELWVLLIFIKFILKHYCFVPTPPIYFKFFRFLD